MGPATTQGIEPWPVSPISLNPLTSGTDSLGVRILDPYQNSRWKPNGIRRPYQHLPPNRHSGLSYCTMGFVRAKIEQLLAEVH